MHNQKKNGHVHSSCAYAYVVALTSENRVDISTSMHKHKGLDQSLDTLTQNSCENIKSNVACVCPYAHVGAYAYTPVKTRLKRTCLDNDLAG